MHCNCDSQFARVTTEILSNGMPEVFENENSFVCSKLSLNSPPRQLALKDSGLALLKYSDVQSEVKNKQSICKSKKGPRSGQNYLQMRIVMSGWRYGSVLPAGHIFHFILPEVRYCLL